MNCIRTITGVLLAFCITLPALAQGVLLPEGEHAHRWRLPRPRPVPRPPVTSYKIKEISIQARIQDQVARTQVTQSFANTGSRQMEVCFVFPLPYDGAVDRLTFMVDGKEYDAKLMTKEEARRIYEGYVRRNQDPALLEWLGTGLFKTSVFPIPPGQARTVTLRYSQLLRKNGQLTDFLFPLSTAQYTSHAVEKLSFHVAIDSATKIKSVYSPTHAVHVTRSDDHHAVVSWEAQHQIPTSDFRLFFDMAKDEVGASVVSYWPADEDHGYFLLLASPDIKSDSAKTQAKNVIFVVDRSGSMSGKKIKQAKESLRFVLNNLREGDLFNVVAYDSEVEAFRPEMQRYDDRRRAEAIGFVNGIFAGGSTNIDEALTSALSMIQDNSRPNYVVFLTDGLPTVGEQNESLIAQNATQQNRHGARLICFGVGYDVNSRLIDRLARENRGQSEFVRPDEELEAHVSRLYDKISAPVMVDVDIDIELEDSAKQADSTNRVYPREVHDVFAGQQVILVGRYSRSGAARIRIRGKVNQRPKSFQFPAEFAARSGNESYAFVEKIWASRRIGEIIDQIDLQGKNQELIDELVALSTQHGIITPYTAFLADDQDIRSLANRRFQVDEAAVQVQRLGQVSGQDAFFQRLSKSSLQSAARLPVADPAIPRLSVRQRGSAAITASPRLLEEAEHAAGAVQHIGSETLYRRENILIAANARDVDPQKDKDQLITVKRYSDQYFRLVAENTKSENALLARQQEGQELIIRLRGEVYRIL